jgi:hypothetical protein
MIHFCTYFDSNYLPRALCLLESLEHHSPEFTIYMLCLDNECYMKIKGLNRPNVIPFTLNELEENDKELEGTKAGRSRLEYYYTCGPAFICYLLDREPGISIITYLDADMYFYSSPEPLFEVFEGHSIGVVGHHLPEFRKSEQEGLYNVGWITFKRDERGLACLNWWRDRCIEWCYERFEDGKYADQRYLDQWPRLFKGFYEFTHHGANVAAWNVGDYQFSLRDGHVYVDNDLLIFYHYHGFKKIIWRIYNTSLAMTFRPPSPVLKQHVFHEYIEKLVRCSAEQNPTASIRKYRGMNLLKLSARCVIGLLFRQYIIMPDFQRQWHRS